MDIIELLKDPFAFLDNPYFKTFAMCAYVLLPILVFFAYRRNAKLFTGERREVFEDAARDAFGSLLFGVLTPMLYLVLSLFTHDFSYVTKDALPMICLMGGGQCAYYYICTKALIAAKTLPAHYPEKKLKLEYIAKGSRLVFCLGLIPLVYGLVTFILIATPLGDHLTGRIWYASFMVSGLGLVYSVWSNTMYSTMKRVYAWPDPKPAVAVHRRGGRRKR
jgi:hypothetical protein